MAEKPRFFPRQKWRLYELYRQADPSLSYRVWADWLNVLYFDDLRPLGYRRSQKTLTNRQLKKVLELIGEP